MSALPAFEAVAVDYWAVAPMLVVVAGALLGVLVEAFAPRESRHSAQVALTVGTLVAAFGVLVWRSVNHHSVTFGS